MTARRASDRWLTPAVVVALVLTGGVVCLGVLAAVTFLTARGFDPAPVVQLTGTLLAAATGMGTFVAQLASRRATTKTERHAGTLGVAALRALEELEAERGRHAYPERGTAPAAAGGSDLDQDASSDAGPSRGPSNSPQRYSDTPQDDLHDTAWYRQ